MAKIQLRHGTTAQWAASDPVLAAGEPGVNDDTGQLKIGNGVSKWSLLTGQAGGQTTRTGVFQMDHPTSSAALGSAVTICTRESFMVPFNVVRFRVHYRNFNFLLGTSPVGSLKNFKGFVGEAADNGTDLASSAFKAAPVQCLPTVSSVASGFEQIGPWITPSTFPILKNKRYMLSTGYDIVASDQLCFGGGGHFVSTDGDKAGLQAANTTTFTHNQNFLDKWIEFEYADDNAPSILVVSNSTAAPGNSNNTVNRGDLDTWINQWAMQVGGIAASIAVAGAASSSFPANSIKWNHYDTLAKPIDFDAVVLHTLSSSDIAGSDGSATAIANAKAAWAVVVAKVKALYPNAQIIGTTNTPRVESTGTKETARVSMNEWHRTCPYGTHKCYELDILMRNPANTAALMPEYSADGTHWKPTGHFVVANNFPTLTRTR